MPYYCECGRYLYGNIFPGTAWNDLAGSRDFTAKKFTILRLTHNRVVINNP